MSIPALIMGRPGSGKTYSLKGFTKDEIGIISVEKGRLPFKSDLKLARVPGFETADEVNSPAEANAKKYDWIKQIIRGAKVPSIAIDDSQYLLSGELFDRACERGYDKFTDMAKNFRDLIHFVNGLDDDRKIVYFLHHSESDTDGREKIKTIGRMLDEKLCVDGCFDIVLYCQDHAFYTQANGMSTAKSPEGMFDLRIPNDLKMVDTIIRGYYGMEVVGKS